MHGTKVVKLVLESDAAPKITLDRRSVPDVPAGAVEALSQLKEEDGLYNGRTYRLLAWRDGPPRPVLALGRTRYFNWLAVRGLLTAGLGPGPEEILKLDPLWSHYFGMTVAVVTADGLVVVRRRSDRVAVWRNVWSLSAGETAEEGVTPLDAWDMVAGTMRSELGVEGPARALSWALAVDTGDGAWTLGAVVRLDMAWHELRGHIALAPDAWEATEAVAVPSRLLLEMTEREEWEPLSGELARWTAGVVTRMQQQCTAGFLS